MTNYENLKSEIEELKKQIWYLMTDINAKTNAKNLTFSANKVLISDDNGSISAGVVSSDELNFLHGVTKSIQSQLNEKANTDATNIDLTSLREAVGIVINTENHFFVFGNIMICWQTVGVSSSGTWIFPNGGFSNIPHVQRTIIGDNFSSGTTGSLQYSIAAKPTTTSMQYTNLGTVTNGQQCLFAIGTKI